MVGVRQTYDQINLNAIKQDHVQRCLGTSCCIGFFLDEHFSKDPDEVIEVLHDKACEDERRDLLYALSELTYLPPTRPEGLEQSSGLERARRYYVASAVYAYYIYWENAEEDPPGPYDRRFRVACDLYNTALAQALTIRKTQGADSKTGSMNCP